MMTINMMNHIEEDLSDYEPLLKQVVNCALELENCPYESEISIVITNNEEIRTYNNDYREKDTATDVLSFPLIEFEDPGDFSSLNLEDESFFNLDSGELMLGDIIISYERACSQANDYGHSIERELGFLTAHSMLHLMGYDHMTVEEDKIMIDKQEAILNKVGLRR